MNYITLEQAGDLFLTIEKMAELLGLSLASARVFASRYVKKGLLIRLKNNLYVLPNKITSFNQTDLFYLSNLLQTPSYISLMSALAYFELTTQIPRNFTEAINPVRSRHFKADGLDFVYNKIQPDLYFGFARQGNFFIATPEKALVDCCYLTALKRYSMDFDSLNLDRFDRIKVQKIAKKFPGFTQLFINNLWHGNIQKTRTI